MLQRSLLRLFPNIPIEYRELLSARLTVAWASPRSIASSLSIGGSSPTVPELQNTRT